MTVEMPETVKSHGMTRLVVLDTAPAGLPTEILHAELEAGVAIQCHVYGDFAATPTQNVGQAPRKMCSTTSPQEFGEVTYPISDIQYSYVPQALATPGSPGNEAFEALPPGAEKWLVEIPGVDSRVSDFDDVDIANVYHVTCGIQRRGRTGDGEFDQFSTTQGFIMADGAEPLYDVPVDAT